MDPLLETMLKVQRNGLCGASDRTTRAHFKAVIDSDQLLEFINAVVERAHTYEGMRVRRIAAGKGKNRRGPTPGKKKK